MNVYSLEPREFFILKNSDISGPRQLFLLSAQLIGIALILKWLYIYL